MPQMTWHCFRGKPSKRRGELHITQDKAAGLGWLWPRRTGAQLTGVVLTRTANPYCALQLKISFQVPLLQLASNPPLACSFLCVYGIVCHLLLWVKGAQLASWVFATSSRSHPAPTRRAAREPAQGHGERHSANPQRKVVLLASFSQNVWS